MRTPSFFSVSGLAAGALALLACLGVIGAGITREVPYGGLEGRVVMQENGRPLPNAQVVLRPDYGLDREAYHKLSEEERPKSYVTETDAEGAFKLRYVKAGDYEFEVYATAHSMRPMKVTIPEGKPSLLDVELKPGNPFLDLYASQQVFRPDESVRVQIHGFTPAERVHISVHRLDADLVFARGGPHRALSPLARGLEGSKVELLGERVAEIEPEITQRDAEGVFRQFFDLPKLEEGLYWMDCEAGGLRRGTYLNVTRLALVLKRGRGQALGFVTDLASGVPVPGAEVYVSGEADASNASSSPRPAVATTDAHGLVLFEWGTERLGSGLMAVRAVKGRSQAFVESWQHWGQDGSTRIFLYTERPVYRPGDTVRFKGIVRRLVGTDYRVPGTGTVAIEIRDPDDTLVERLALPLSEMGTFFGQFATRREASTGPYEIKVRFGQHEQSEWVPMAAYRKPEYSVKVYPERPYYVRGQRARMIVDVQYYFGAPVAGAKVSASVYRSPRWEWLGSDVADLGADEDYEAGGRYGGEWMEELEATTDESGKAYISFRTDYADPWDDETDTDFFVAASVTEGDKYFSGEGSVKVVRGELGLSADCSQYVADIGVPVETVVRAFRQDTLRPLTGLAVKLTAGFEVWTGRESVFRPMESRTVTTDSEGRASATFTPNRGGSFVVRAEALDRLGNRVAAASYVYVYGGALSDMPPTAGMLSLRLDKRAYAVGDTIRAVIETNRPGGWALVTTEGERVYDQRIVELEGGATSLELPVSAIHRPNAFLSVCYIKDKRFAHSTRRFATDLGEKRLKVSISSDKGEYGPGDRATYTIRTTDEAGKPVSSEISVGIVDESIYAIREDVTDIASGFYPKRYNAVRTDYSFEPIYLDGGDKAPQDIQIRTRFLDTAGWFPAIRTDASGSATVSLKLPDNLTTWRATVVGLTADTAVGMATHKIRAKRDLMVRLLTPAFAVQKDRLRVLAMVTNDTNRDAEVNVELDVVGASREGGARQKLQVEAGRTRSAAWWLAADRAGTAQLTVKAWIAGGPSDGMRSDLEVQPHGREVVEYQSGEITDSTSAIVSVRPGADPATGTLSVVVSPSIASSLIQSLDGLLDYPYGCVEQTMSRFLPAAVVMRAIRDAGLPPPRRAADIPEIVAEGFTRLRRMQHADGGWGWWEYDSSDVFMTAMVLEGLFRAKEAGFHANPAMVGWAMGYLEKQLAQTSDSPPEQDWSDRTRTSQRAYAAYALALWGRSEAALDALAEIDPTLISAHDAANVALAYAALGPSFAAQRDRALGIVVRAARVTGNRASWETRYWGSETNARCLLALATIRVSDPLVAKAVRQILLDRRGGLWFSTRDTSYVLLALTEYWKATGALSATGEITVSLNGKPIRKLAISRESLTAPDLRLDIPLSELREGENRLAFTRTGTGTSYYSLEMRQAIVQDRLGPMTTGPGFSVERRFYSMYPQRTEDGSLRLLPSEHPVNDARRGDVLRCVVKVATDRRREFVMVEVPIPSNVHVTEREQVGLYEEWGWWFDRIVVRDDRVAFFVRDMPPGTHTFSFAFQAENPGQASALPAVAYNMYDPGERASSAETPFRVRE